MKCYKWSLCGEKYKNLKIKKLSKNKENKQKKRKVVEKIKNS